MSKTYVVKYTQGSGPVSVTLRGCNSEQEAKAKFWEQPHIKNNKKTKIESVKSY